MPCKYNDPSVFSTESKKKFLQLKRARRQLSLLKKKMVDKTQWKGEHPHDIALDIQIMAREISALFDEIRPKLVS
jgi:hypothetical protein